MIMKEEDIKLLPSSGTKYVYQLKNNLGIAVYIGQASNLRARVRQHKTSGKNFCFVDYDATDKGMLNNKEASLIVSTGAELNKTLPPNDFYKSKLSVRAEIVKNINCLFDSIEDDFKIKNSKDNNERYIAGWKALLIKDVFSDAVKDALKLTEEV